MTVKEIIERNKDKYDFVEIFYGEKLHTDFCDRYNPQTGYGDCEKGQEERLNRYCVDYEAKDWELMSCEEYNNSILANCGMKTSDYGLDGSEKILCILITRESIAKGEELGM